MKTLPHLCVAIALLTGGVLVGRAWTTGESSSEGLTDPSVPPVLTIRSEATPPSSRGKDSNGLRSALERLDAAALRALVLEQHAALASLSGRELEIRRKLLDAALEELWRRQGTVSLEWAASLERKEERGALSHELLENALHDDPAAAMEWMEKFHAEFGKSETNNKFLSIAMKGAAGRDADEVIRVFGMFSGVNLVNPLFSARFGEGFDFAKLYGALHDKTDLSGAVSQWTLRDRDAAWSAVSGSPPPARPDPYRDPFGSLMKTVIAVDGEAAGVAWIMGRLASLSPEERGKRLNGLDRGGMLSPEGVAIIASALPPDERAAYAAAITKDSGASARAYAALDTLPRADLLDALRTDLRGSNSAIGPAPGTPAYAPYMERIADEVKTRYQLTSEEAAAIGYP